MEDLTNRVAALEQSLQEMKAHFARRLRFWRSIALALLTGGLILLSLHGATAQGPQSNLEARVAALESKLAHFSRSGNDIFITGANLHIVNGLSMTDTTNGLGNLIVGYNEPRGDEDQRGGSHNVVVGRRHFFTSFGGLVVGDQNSILGSFASVSGGTTNKASGSFSSVSGGTANQASGTFASVSGGFANMASATGASVSGGAGNLAESNGASVSGGRFNTAFGFFTSVSGGQQVGEGTHDGGWSAGSLGGETFKGNFRSP
jgi:hypothetical protein